MNDWWLHTKILIAISLIAACTSLIRLKKADKASKHIITLLTCSFFVESIAAWAAVKYHQNNVIYNIYHLFQLLIICLYFNQIIDVFKKKKIGLIIAGIGTILALVNTIFFQSIFILNTNFLAFSSLVIVGMCLYYYYDFLLKDTYSNHLPVHFWFTGVLLIYWSFTYFHWVVGLEIMTSETILSSWTSLIILGINVLIYLAFALVFLNYNKFENSGYN